MSLFKKLFRKHSSPDLARVVEAKWFIEADYGPTRMQKREDGTVEFLWLEEGSPYGVRFPSPEKAAKFLSELKPANFKENWNIKEEDINWTDPETWE